MHTYCKVGDVWLVGFEYESTDTAPFRAIKEFPREEWAAAFASYLNGGAPVRPESAEWWA